MSSRSCSILAVVSAVTFGALAACSDDPGNAPRLWLALDGRETEVRLVEFEPPPF